MIAYRMLYAVAVGVPVVLAAWMVAGVLRRHGRAERGVWLAGLVLALVLPAVLMVRPLDALRAPSAHTDMTASSEASDDADGGADWQLPTLVIERASSSRSALDSLLLAAWLLASFGLALRWAVSTRRLAHVASAWRASNVSGSDVWVTSDSGPAVTGVLGTRILVPEWLLGLPSEQQALVLLHEEEHVRAGDPALMACSRVARILTPWNPVVWILTSRLLGAVETDCDRRVLRRGPDVRKYCDTLFAISARRPSRLVGAAAFAEPRLPLQKRIIAMTTPRRSLSVLTVLFIVAVGAVLVVGSCGVPLPTERDATVQPSVLGAPGTLKVVVSTDGTVTLDGEPYPMSDVSDVVAERVAAAPDPLVAVIDADADVPYRHLDRLQEELRAGGAVRVAFRVMVAAEPATTSSGWDALAIVLPEAGMGLPTSVSQRNLLKLHVLPSGALEVKRGDGTQVQVLRAEDVTGLWRQEVRANPRLIASITSDWDATYAQVMAVLDALQVASAQRISLTGVVAQ